MKLPKPLTVSHGSFPTGYTCIVEQVSLDQIKEIKCALPGAPAAKITGRDYLSHHTRGFTYPYHKGDGYTWQHKWPTLAELTALASRPNVIPLGVRRAMLQHDMCIVAWGSLSVTKGGHFRVPVLEHITDELFIITWARLDSPLAIIETTLT